jgi:hypothetical protein
VMDVHTLSEILTTTVGCVATTVDASDHDLNDRSDLSPADLAELGLRLPRNPCPAGWWQTTVDQAEHLDQPSFTSSFNKVRWFALRSLEDQGSLTNDSVELDRIESEREYWLGRTEADHLFEIFRLAADQAANVANICPARQRLNSATRS